jgi:hypothetical protein
MLLLAASSLKAPNTGGEQLQLELRLAACQGKGKSPFHRQELDRRSWALAHELQDLRELGRHPSPAAQPATTLWDLKIDNPPALALP